MTSTYIAFAGKVHSSSLLCNMQMWRMWRCTLPVWRKQLRKKRRRVIDHFVTGQTSTLNVVKGRILHFFLLWIHEKKQQKNKCGEDESKFISIIDNVYPVFRFVFFLLLLSFFVVDEFFQQYYICWITVRSPSHIYKHLLRFLCNKMPCRPIYFFFLHFILFNSKALEFFFFFLSL